MDKKSTLDVHKLSVLYVLNANQSEKLQNRRHGNMNRILLQNSKTTIVYTHMAKLNQGANANKATGHQSYQLPPG